MDSGFGEEPLSLGTFDPQNAQAPYLNTPRSLEACRRFGINPIELVEVSPEEFRKDAPDDSDAAQRRYERIDGARRKMLTNVVVEWKSLVESGWEPVKPRPNTGKERIIDVRPGAHSTLLELQAEKFRKIEEAQFKGLQRMLSISVQKADQEVKNMAVMQKHEEQKAANDDRARQMQAKREALFKKQMEERKQKELDEAARIKMLQEMDAKEAKQKLKEKEEKEIKDRRRREAREADRLRREQYTLDLKKGIMEQMELKASQRQKLNDLKAAESNQRKAEAEMERQKNQKKRQMEQSKRQAEAKREAQEKAERERQDMLDRIESDEAKRKRIKDQREMERQMAKAEGEIEGEAKRKARKAAADAVLEGKIKKTASELQFKDMLAKNELDKVEAARKRRQQLKEIRQEAFDLAAARRKKAMEHGEALRKQAIKDKDDKCQAIQDGFKTLSKMRNKMKDIVNRTTMELKDEIHNMHHKGIVSPEKVVSKSLGITKQSLFPQLKRSFGLVEPTTAAEEARVAEMMEEDHANATAAPGATLDKSGATGRPKTPGGTRLPIKNMSVGELEYTLARKQTQIAAADEIERERLEAKKSASKSPSRSRGGSPTTRQSPGNGDGGASTGRSRGTRGRNAQAGEGKEGKADGMGGTNGMRSHKSTFMDPGKDEFRREYSGDHPLAPGGKGNYKNERATGKKAVSVKKMSYTDKTGMTPAQASRTVEKLSLQSQNPIVDPEKHLEQLRKEQNDALIRVLEEERGAEESRERMAFAVLSEAEAQRMELVFAEERRRASERIVNLTREHEKRIKDAVLAMMSLKKHNKIQH